MSVGKIVTKGVAWNTASTFVEKFIVLGNVFLMLAYLSVHEYGLVQLVLSTISIASIALLPGFADAVIADFAVEHGRANKSKTKEILLRYNALILVLSVAAWAVLFFGSNFIVTLEGGVLASYYLKIASFMLLISPVRNVIMMLFTVSLRFREQAIYSMAEEASKLFFLIIFLVWLDRGPEGMLYATVLSQLAAVLLLAPFAWPFAREILQAPGVSTGPFWKSLSAHRIWSITNSYVGTVTSTLQLWIVKLLLGTEAVALFSVAQGLVAHVASFLPLNSVIVPILPRYIDRPEFFRKALRTSVKAQVVGAFGLIVAGAIAGPLLLYVLFPKYIPALPLYGVLLLGLIPSAVAALFTPVFATLKRQRSYFYSSIIKTLLTATVFFGAIWWWGILGAAIGSVLVLMLSTLERIIRVQIIAPDYALTYSKFFSLDPEERALFQDLISTLRKRLLRTQ